MTVQFSSKRGVNCFERVWAKAGQLWLVCLFCPPAFRREWARFSFFMAGSAVGGPKAKGASAGKAHHHPFGNLDGTWQFFRKSTTGSAGS